MKIKAPRGTHDILPEQSGKWQYVEEQFRKQCFYYGYKEIRTPVFEHTELFARGIGDSTDIVEKEMYTFQDKKDRSLTLRPEFTANTMRSIIEHNLPLSPPLKLFYMGPIFRYERPQKGRYRQAHQLGVEFIGLESPLVDVEVIEFIIRFYQSLGLKGLSVSLNSIGCSECRSALKEKVRDFCREKLSSFCNNCQNRYERNPFRIMDCKKKSCKEHIDSFPGLLGSICKDCREHFNTVTAFLDKLHIPYKIDNTMVRGLDYYTRTVFEVVSGSLGAQSSLCGGGRYDDLMTVLGGNPSPGIGFAAGIERAIIVMEEEKVPFPDLNKLDLILLPMGEKALNYAFELASGFRKECFMSVEINLSDRSLKSQLKVASKMGAEFALIIGEIEIENKEFIIRNMISREQITLREDKMMDYFRQNIKR